MNKFDEVLVEMSKLHAAKEADYGKIEEVGSNLMASEDFGVDAWVGCMIRANDKMARIKKFARSGKLENEKVEDSLLDLANYAVLALLLYRELMGDTPTIVKHPSCSGAEPPFQGF